MEIDPAILREGKKVLVGLPWYKSASPLTTFCLLAMADRRTMGFSLGFGDAFIAHSRNKLATQFVNSSMEWLISCDDDMVLPMGDAAWFNGNSGMNLPEKFAGMHTFDRLLSHGKTIVGATYFGRWKKGHPVFAEGQQMEDFLRRNGPVDECRPTRWIGTGCSIFHRTVFLDIERQFPQLSREANGGVGQWFTSSEHDLHKAVEEIEARGPDQDLQQVLRELSAARVKSGIHSSLGMGEDVQCCIRASQSGHQPHVDLGLWCGHVGSFVYPLLK